jgi:hypothetical protein
MKKLGSLPLLFALVLAAHALLAAEPLYTNNFESAPVGKPPEGMMVMSGDFTVKQDAEGKFLELPGEPLDTFGLLFGPSTAADVTASARFFGTKTGRKYPTFGVSVNGVGGYRLQVSPGRKTLELYKGDELRTSVGYEWPSGTWVQLQIEVRKRGEKECVVEGKAWPIGTPMPKTAMITLTDPEPASAGRAGIWGSPYSGTPIRFDDLVLAPAP